MKLLNPKFHNDLILLNKTRTVEHLLPQFIDGWAAFPVDSKPPGPHSKAG